MLIGTTICALLAIVWVNPPEDSIRIQIDEDGMVSVDGVAVEPEQLRSCLKRRRLWLSVWHRNPRADICCDKSWVLNADPRTTFLPLVKSVEDSGFVKPTIIIDPYTAKTPQNQDGG